MVAAYHDRCAYVPRRHQLVEGKPGLCTVPVSQPADPCRQPLKRDSLGGHVNPSLETFVVTEKIEDGAVGRGDVGRVAGQCRPSKRPLALAEQRTNVSFHESGDLERVGNTYFRGLRSNVVAVFDAR